MDTAAPLSGVVPDPFVAIAVLQFSEFALIRNRTIDILHISFQLIFFYIPHENANLGSFIYKLRFLMTWTGKVTDGSWSKPLDRHSLLPLIK